MESLASHNRSVTAQTPGFWSKIMSCAEENYITFEKLLLILFWSLVGIECLHHGTSCDCAAHASYHEVGAADALRT